MRLDAATASRASQAPPPPPAVTVVRAAAEDIRPTFRFTGRIEAISKVDLRARVDGFLEKRLFTEGADVKEGDLLFVIEKGLYQAAVDEAKAGVEKAEAALKLAEIELTRQSELVQRNVGAAGKARRSHRAKQGEARGDGAGAEGRLERAELQLGYTDIRSPIAGRIGRANVSVGNFVGAVERRVGDDRQPGSDLCRLSGDPARNAGFRKERGESARRGEIGVPPTRRRQPLRPDRQDRFPRRDGEPGHRHGPGPRDLSQSRPLSGRRPAGRGRGRGRRGREARSWCRGRHCSSIRRAHSCWWSTRTNKVQVRRVEIGGPRGTNIDRAQGARRRASASSPKAFRGCGPARSCSRPKSSRRA